MTFMAYVQEAYRNLFASKLRTGLAMLGVLVGTASVVALLSCGQLATEAALAEFKALGTDLLAISVFQEQNKSNASTTAQVPLSVWRSMPKYIPSINNISPYSTAYQPMAFQGKVLDGAIIGADDSLAKTIHISMASGHFISFLHTREPFCVIGHAIAEQIQSITLDNPIGKPLRLGNTMYTIIGIAAPWQENSFFNENINRAVIIPIQGMNFLTKDSKINNAIIVLKPKAPIDDVIASLKTLIEKQSPNLSFYPRSAKQIIASMESQGRIFTLLLGVIGAIALLVGGIGIMNIMLVSVSERKQEIGIRKAIGAKNRDIQALFLVESILLSLIGGSIGVMLGLVVTKIIAYFSHWPFVFYAFPPFAGFFVSVITGIFFGFYPAKRAAKLDPIISLRTT
jgi:putative ABC transport system permease protein